MSLGGGDSEGNPRIRSEIVMSLGVELPEMKTGDMTMVWESFCGISCV